MNINWLLFGLLLAAGLAAWLIGNPEEPSRREAAVAETFQIFRTPEESFSAPEKRRINKGLETYGADRVLRHQLVKTDRGRLWVIETHRLICISHTRGMACSPRRRADHEGVSLGVFDPPNERQPRLHNFLVQGVVPDEITQVVLLINNQQQTVLEVEDNVFSAAAKSPIHVKRLLRN